MLLLAALLLLTADSLRPPPPPAASLWPGLRLSGLDDSDESLERRMALEVFDELRGESAELPLEAFKRWEDVADLIGESS